MAETAVHLIFRRNLTIWPNIGCTVLVCQAVESFLFHGSNEIFRCFSTTFSFSVWKVSFLKVREKSKSSKFVSWFIQNKLLFSRKISQKETTYFLDYNQIGFSRPCFNFNFLSSSKMSKLITSKISILFWLACFKKKTLTVYSKGENS